MTSELRIVTAGCTNVGKRDNNEDTFGIIRWGRYDVLFVADGLGGHSHGELASAAVADNLKRRLDEQEFDLAGDLDWVRIFEGLNADVLVAGGQTVLSVAALNRETKRLTFAWAGDAPMLYVSGDRICLMKTKPHGFGNYVMTGLGFTRDRDDHSGLNEHWQPEVWSSATLQPHDVVIVASDGLDTLFDDDPRLVECGALKQLPLPKTIKKLSHNELHTLDTKGLEGVCERMIAGAMKAGSTDNCTLVMGVVQG